MHGVIRSPRSFLRPFPSLPGVPAVNLWQQDQNWKLWQGTSAWQFTACLRSQSYVITEGKGETSLG